MSDSPQFPRSPLHRRTRRWAALVLAAAGAALAFGCASGSSGASRAQAGSSSPERYRLSASGEHWDRVGSDPVVEDLVPRYPAFFEVVLDPSETREPDLRELRDDLERRPADRRNFDALNAIAIGYFELNFRAETARGGDYYFANSFRAAKLLAVPWRAYGEIEDPRLRDAVLDFFTDAASGEKLETAGTAGRIARIVESLERKETDPDRLQRIEALAKAIRQAHPEAD